MNYCRKMKAKFKRLPKKCRISFCVISGLVVVWAVFLLGVNYGNGNISWSNGMSNGLPAQLNYSSVNQLYQVLKANYDGTLTQTQLLNGIKHGLAQATNDPYTEYFTANEAKTFNSELNNSFSGIGAELSQNSQGEIEVMSPLQGSPAIKAGLQPHDIIAAINNQSTSNMTVEQAVVLIRGKAGTTVTLTIVRGNNEFNVSIKRANITVPSVTYKILSGNLGYIAISTFANDTAALIQKAAQDMVSHHVKGIILDLRNDPGGLVTAAVATTSEWLKPGQVIMQEKKGSQVLQTYYATGGDILNGIPTVVLINGGSASASEITTGALHDHKDAYVMGTKSYGKGVVQQLINLSDGGQLKVTIASWYRPNGKNINKIGITPDQVVQPASNGSDNQLTAAESYLNSH